MKQPQQEKRGRGRPRKPADPDQIRRAAALHCTMEEIAHLTGLSVNTLERNFGESIKAGRSQGKRSLRRLQYKLAKNGNAAMAIWLGKQLLGQRDKFEHSQDEERPLIPVKALQEIVKRWETKTAT